MSGFWVFVVLVITVIVGVLYTAWRDVTTPRPWEMPRAARRRAFSAPRR